MAHAGGSGGEATIHAAAGMERLAVLHMRAVENLDRITARIFERHDFEHVTVDRQRARTDFVTHARRRSAV